MTSAHNRRTRLLVAWLAVLALAAGLATAGAAQGAQTGAQTEPGDLLDPRTYDAAAKPFLTLHATGVQRYACQASGGWLFSDPVATLHSPQVAGKAIGSHFLNFATGRPVWELKDGSSVEAARIASAPGGAGNIAELLLQAVVTTAGEDGDRLHKTAWVQRLNTAGGVAPGGSCTPGAVLEVPYGTDYVFWATEA